MAVFDQHASPALEDEASWHATGNADRATSFALNRMVFISHASEDASTANVVCEAIESAGGKCWIAPRDIQPGMGYLSAIANALEACSAVVLILSSHTEHSTYVIRELEITASRKVLLVPLCIERTPLRGALKLLLSSVQRLDATSGGLEQALRKLLAILSGKITPPPTWIARTLARVRETVSKPKLTVTISISLGALLFVLVRPPDNPPLTAHVAGAWSVAQGGAGTEPVLATTPTASGAGGVAITAATGSSSGGGGGAGRRAAITCCTEAGVGKPCYQPNCQSCGLRIACDGGSPIAIRGACTPHHCGACCDALRRSAVGAR